MIGTELSKGQGLGNQLFCYITTRCIAMDMGVPFSILGGDTVANNIHSGCGMYFMDLDYGQAASKEDFEETYYEKSDRLYIGNSKHDLTHGCYVTGVDENIFRLKDKTLIYGNLQDEKYYIKYKDEIREWLKVKKEYDCMEYSKDNLCILHLRCSDYLGYPELYLRKKYWEDGIRHMKKINSQMEFMIITNDVKEANKILPGIPAYNFDLAKDYSIAYFPAFTSTTVKYILAPKYWARHNVSDGYWASEQNIYTGWNYMDKNGRVFSAEECRNELVQYKKKSNKYKKINKKPTKFEKIIMKIQSSIIYFLFRLKKNF